MKTSLSKQDLSKELLDQLPALLSQDYEVTVTLFAELFKSIFGFSYALPLNSGTSALHLALKAAGVTQGDLVLCSDLTYVASAFPINYCGAIPAFVDVDKNSWNMSASELEEAVEAAVKGKIPGIKAGPPKAIVVVHLFGMPADMHQIQKVASEYEITIIEDAAEAVGASIGNDFAGSFGKFGCFSFNNNKIVTTFGGGMLVCKDRDSFEKADYLSSQARTKGQGYTHYEMGFNYKINLLAAALGCLTLPLWSAELQSRKQVNEFYRSFLPNLSFQERPGNHFNPNHWLSAVLFANEKNKLAALDHLAAYNIEARSVWKPMHLQPFYEHSAFFGSGNSDDVFKRGLCLPSSGSLNPTILQEISELVSKFS